MSGGLGKLEAVDPRELWKNEAHNFTPWLQENIRLLSDSIGVNIEVIGKEEDVGDFNVDLVGKDLNSGHLVIIENQLESTDHDHLGKLMTYAAGKDAYIAIWIATEFRDEHRQALNWLNDISGEGRLFFGIVLKAYKIGNSMPAPYFDIVVKPNQWVKEERVASEITPTQLAYQKFFTELLGKIRTDIKGLTSATKGQPQNWYLIAAGRSGFGFSVYFSNDGRFYVGMEIDTGDKECNKAAFDFLLKNKNEIEREIGETLQWNRNDSRQMSEIYVSREGTIKDSDAALVQLQNWVTATLQKFNKAFRSRISSIPKQSNA